MVFCKKAKQERQLIEEIKRYAEVIELPQDDARSISEMLTAYKYHGQPILILPEQAQQRPDPQFIDWHRHDS